MSDQPRETLQRRLITSRKPTWLLPRSMIIGAIGAALFWLIGMPLPWLTGSLLFATCANLSGVPVGFPPSLREALLALLGIAMGTGISIGAFQAIAQWPISAIGLLVTVVMITAAGSGFFQRFAGWDRATALMASLPGALAYVVALVNDTKADQQKVIIAQALRVFLLVFLLPPLLLLGHDVTVATSDGTTAVMSLGQIVAISILTGAAGWIMTRAKIPAPFLTAGLVVCGTAHIMGFVAGGLPTPIQNTVFVAFGCFIGSRFMGSGWRDLARNLLPATAGVILMTVISFAAALLVSQMIDLSLGAIMLAFVPGGLEAMIIIALVLDLEPVYVTAHHFLRMLALVFTMPLIIRFMRL